MILYYSTDALVAFHETVSPQHTLTAPSTKSPSRIENCTDIYAAYIPTVRCSHHSYKSSCSDCNSVQPHAGTQDSWVTKVESVPASSEFALCRKIARLMYAY